MTDKLLAPSTELSTVQSSRLKLRHLPLVFTFAAAVATIVCVVVVIEAAAAVVLAGLIAAMLIVGLPVLFVGAWREGRRKDALQKPE